MCTVSFIPGSDALVITSNRDEHIDRPNSYYPKEEMIDGIRVIFPKDPKAGGTWFAINEAGVVGVLLNGAFKKQKRRENYRKSRGLVVLQVISKPDPFEVLKKMNLEGIEAFTLLVLKEGKLVEFRWDESNKHFTDIAIAKNHIWSSVTLYDELVINQREALFAQFVNSTDSITEENIMDFHLNNHGDYTNGFVIDRDNGLKTFSVTQAIVTKSKVTLRHLDLINHGSYTITLENDQLLESVK